MDRGALWRLKNARDALHGNGDARNRLFCAWIDLVPLTGGDFPDPARFEMMMAAVTTVEDPEAGSLRATIDAMPDGEVTEASSVLSAYLTELLRPAGM